MELRLEYKAIAFDSNVIPPNVTIAAETPISFFGTEQPHEGQVITDTDEGPILDWLVNFEPTRTLLLESLGVPQRSFIATAVKRPIIPNDNYQPGDIDLIICPGGVAKEAIGIQAKRVKIRSLSQKQDHSPTKLNDTKKLVAQANAQRHNLGFHRNYMAIITQVDGRNRIESNTVLRGPTRITAKAIYEFPDREKLHSDVGIIFIEISQPTEKTYTSMATVGVCVNHEAIPLDQLDSLTERIRELMAIKAATR